jgi:hypothetical protein
MSLFYPPYACDAWITLKTLFRYALEKDLHCISRSTQLASIVLKRKKKEFLYLGWDGFVSAFSVAGGPSEAKFEQIDFFLSLTIFAIFVLQYFNLQLNNRKAGWVPFQSRFLRQSCLLLLPLKCCHICVLSKD